MSIVVPKIKIWVVEDNHSYRKEFLRLVERSDTIECTNSFTNCEETLQELERVPPPDVLLMDIGLPGISGLEGIVLIKRMFPNLPIMVLTVQDDDHTVFEAIRNGASGYLLKASPLENIVESVRIVYRGGAPINPQIAKKILEQFIANNDPNDLSLSQREKDVLQFLVDGQPNKRIAVELNLSLHTVDSHIRNIYSKLHVNNRSSAVAKAIKLRLI